MAAMGATAFERAVLRQAGETRRAIGGEIRRQREDAGMSRAELARRARIDPRYLARIEDAERSPSIETLAAISLALRADLSLRLYPTTGPLIHDRTQAAMEEGFLGELHPRWRRDMEVTVHRPARGVIDLVLVDPDPPVVLASEFQSQIRRLEQQVAWHRQKAEALPSADLWRVLDAAPRAISRLLVLRSTVATRELARTHERTLRDAYPARAADALASLRGDAAWPGAAIVWMRVIGARAWLLPGPPPNVTLGR